MSNNYERLVEAQMNGDTTFAMVRSVGKRKAPVYDETAKKIVTKEVECAIFELDGGVKGFCPITEFSEHAFNSLVGFVGTTQELINLRIRCKRKDCCCFSTSCG